MNNKKTAKRQRTTLDSILSKLKMLKKIGTKSINSIQKPPKIVQKAVHLFIKVHYYLVQLFIKAKNNKLKNLET
jgi:hypothetical protein